MTSRTSSDVAVEVEGLDEVFKGLKSFNKSLGTAITRGLREFAKELKRRGDAKGKSLGGVHRHAVKMGGLSPFARSASAGIKLAASKSPAIFGAEFGAKKYPQFPRWKGNQFTNPTGSDVGYMLHPAMREYLPEAEEQLLDELERQLAKEIGADIQ